VSLYSSTVLADSPIRYYRLGETSGTVATDLGSQAQNGTYTSVTLNQTALIKGDTDPSVLFNGSSSKVAIPTTSLPTGASSWTMEAWVKTPSVLPSSGFPTVMMFGTNSGANQASIGYNQSTGKFTLSSWVANNVSSATVTTSTLYHLVGTYNGTTAIFYVNGVSAGSAAYAYSITASLADIGTDTTGSDFWNGTIDEVAWYSTVLSSTQVALHYNIGIASLMASSDGLSASDSITYKALTALPLYFTNTAGSTLGTTSQMSITHGTDNVNVTQLYSLIGTSTAFGEITAQGTASAWAASGSIGSPTGKGFMLETAILNLVGNTLAAGPYTANLRLNTGHTDGTLIGSVTGCTLHFRLYKYNGGVYTQLIDMSLAGQTVNGTITTYALSGTTNASTTFVSGDLLYADIWVTITTNAGGDAALNFRLNRISTNSTGDSNFEILTTGYSSGVTTVTMASTDSLSVSDSYLLSETLQPTEALTVTETPLLSETSFATDLLCASEAQASYAAMILADSPKAYYRLNESSGTVAHDLTNNNQHGKLSGTFTLAQTGLIAGDSDTAILFDGTTGVFSFPYTLNYTSWSVFSLEFWISTAGVSQHVAVTSTGTTTLVYLNGALTTAGTKAPIEIGSIFDFAGSYLSSIIDEVAIYQAILTPVQIANHAHVAAPTYALMNTTWNTIESLLVSDIIPLVMASTDALSASDGFLLTQTVAQTDSLSGADTSLFSETIQPIDALSVTETPLLSESIQPVDALSVSEAPLLSEAIQPTDSLTQTEAPFFVDTVFTIESLTATDAALYAFTIIETVVLSIADTPLFTKQTLFVDNLAQTEALLFTENTLFSDGLSTVESFSETTSLAVNEALSVVEIPLTTQSVSIADGLTQVESIAYVETFLPIDPVSVSESMFLFPTLTSLDVYFVTDFTTTGPTIIELLSVSDLSTPSQVSVVSDAVTISDSAFFASTPLAAELLSVSDAFFTQETATETAPLSITEFFSATPGRVELLTVSEQTLLSSSVMVTESAGVLSDQEYASETTLFVDALSVAESQLYPITVAETSVLSLADQPLAIITEIESALLSIAESMALQRAALETGVLSVSEISLNTTSVFVSESNPLTETVLETQSIFVAESTLVISDGCAVQEAFVPIESLSITSFWSASFSRIELLSITESVLEQSTVFIAESVTQTDQIALVSSALTVDLLSASDRGLITQSVFISETPVLSETVLETQAVALTETLNTTDGLLVSRTVLIQEPLQIQESLALVVLFVMQEHLLITEVHFDRATTTITVYLASIDILHATDRQASFSSFIIPTTSNKRALTTSSGQHILTLAPEHSVLSLRQSERILE